ncbi:MAG: creatininase family protein [candidate division WOR-3 bacterium]
MNWQELSTHEHSRRRFEAALLPVGTLEAHDGGPVGTDNLIPDALCDRLSEKLSIPKLPLMPYGVTNSLLVYPGSCSLTDEVLEGFIYELGKTLARNGLKYLFVVNGHGGNTEPLRAGARRLFRDTGLFVAIIDWWVETRKDAEEIFGKGGMGHSAIDEMAALLGFCPEFRDSMPGAEVPAHYYWQGVRVYPVPRPVIVYENPDERVDFSRLTPEKCAGFADRITDVMERMILGILEGWREI